MVVVAGNDHDLARGAERVTELDQEVAPGCKRLAQRRVAQLEHVAEQDHAVDAVERREQRRPQLRAAHQVGPLARTEVQIRDDEGAQWPVRRPRRAPGGSSWGA